MIASIIITGDTKEKYLVKTIKSCLDQNINDVQIILVFSRLKNILHLKKLFKKKIIFKQIRRKFSIPVRDQLYKIKNALKLAKGKYIFLLDGDDYFKKTKLKSLINYSKKRELIIDDHLIELNNELIYIKEKFYKNMYLYKLFFNSWPDKVCTSCISGDKSLFVKFYKNIDINKINYLAIDILIVLFNFKNLKKINKILTVKKIVSEGVDQNYSNLLKPTYWRRRLEQHFYFRKVVTIHFSVEYYFCKFIVLLFDFRKCIQKIF